MSIHQFGMISKLEKLKLKSNNLFSMIIIYLRCFKCYKWWLPVFIRDTRYICKSHVNVMILVMFIVPSLTKTNNLSCKLLSYKFLSMQLREVYSLELTIRLNLILYYLSLQLFLMLHCLSLAI